MKSRRGITTIVATVFLVAVVVASLTYITYSLELMANFSEQLVTEETRKKNVQDEAFAITTIGITAANKIDGVIKNTGEIPFEVSTIWIDEQGVNDVVQKFSLNTAIAPGKTADIVDLIDYTIDPTKGYNMKVVSSRGEVVSFYINSPSQESLLMEIRAIPEYVPAGFTTTILYSVVNNMSNNNILYNVTPLLTISDLVGSDVGKELSDPVPASYPALGPGDIAVFEYSIKMSGDTDDSALFNATLVNGVPGNWVTTDAIIKEITLATQAGTSLEALGLSQSGGGIVGGDLLYYHDETALTPNSEYNMDGADPAGTGTMVNPRNGDVTFLTADVTVPTVIVSGPWNMRLSYFSELSPVGVPDPDYAFHFECTGCGGDDDTSDSTGNISLHDFDEISSANHYKTGGPDNDGRYELGNNNDYLKGEWDLHDDYTSIRLELDEAASTAVWVKIPPTSDKYFPIVHWGNAGEWGGCDWGGGSSCDDTYEIALGDGDPASRGNIIFQYDTEKASTKITKCETDGSYDYDDGNWHFLVATRSGDDDCKLYIDGYLVDDTEECINCSGLQYLDFDGSDMYLGYNGDGEECKNCSFGSFMHWANTVLSPDEIEELYYTNFGDNGTRLDWAVYRTNTAGVNQGAALYSGTQLFPFADPAIHSTVTRYDALTLNGTFEKYSFYNATFTLPTNTTLSTGDRIKSVLSWPGDNQNLEMNIRIDDDDAGFILPDQTSYIQTPIMDPATPTFVSISKNDEVEYLIFNNGPEGAWFTYSGTRFVITLPDGTYSYGGLIQSINGSSVTETQDSIFIPDQNAALLKFYKLSNPPQTSPDLPELATPDNYNAAVFLSGFDDEGKTFLRTIN